MTLYNYCHMGIPQHYRNVEYSGVQEIIAHDPFYQNEIAQYEIIEFEASKYCPEFKTIIGKPFGDK